MEVRPDVIDPGEEPAPQAPYLEFRACDISEIVRESVALASEASPSVVVEVSTAPTLPAAAEAEALEGVIRFLVDHACRRSEAGVTVKAKGGDEGISVHVIDRGPGLDREKIAAAFSEPARPGGETEGLERSLVGLNLARGLVVLHGGILWAEPLPAGGNRVAFTIPQEPASPEGPDLEAATEARRLLTELEALSPAAAGPAESEPEGPRHMEYLLDEGVDDTAVIEVAVIADLASMEPAVEDPVGEEELTVPPDPTDDPPPVQIIALDPVALLPEPEPPPADAPATLPEVAAVEEVALPDPEPVHAAPPPPQDVEESETEPVPTLVPVPVAAGEGGKLSSRQVRAVRPPAYVLDPLHPATQMLRGLALDFDTERDL
jgi:hypothetical protein